MNGEMALIDRFSDARVLVVGEAMLDCYLSGSSTRVCQEGPAPVVNLTGRRYCPGGAANTAANVAALGGRATFLSVVGDDDEGRVLRRCLDEYGVATGDLLVDPRRTTLSKSRLLAEHQILVRIDQGSTEDVASSIEKRLLNRLEFLMRDHDAVVISDYGYGIVTTAAIELLGRLQHSEPRLVVVDGKDVTRFRGVGITAATPNFDEVTSLINARDLLEDRVERLNDAGDVLLDAINTQLVAVTLDVDGALFFERGKAPYRTYAKPTKNLRATGAGDTFAAALTLAIAAGAPTHTAAEIASAAASVVLDSDVTATCSRRALESALFPHGKRLADGWELKRLGEHYRNQGERVVFTNGCFDILHAGHVAYLSAAKALGDRLIVGINSDDSVCRLKGDGRPFNSIEDRVHVLSALSCVDHVVVFDGDTPVDLIEGLCPDLFVKGGDYSIDMLPEAPVVQRLGGDVRILPYVEDRSTTAIVERIRGGREIRLEPDGAEKR